MKTNKFTQAQIQAWIINQLSKEFHLNKHDINPKLSFAAMGLGSLQAVSFSGSLEKWLGKPVSPTLFLEQENITKLSAFLAQSVVDEEINSSALPKLPRVKSNKVFTDFSYFPEIVGLEKLKQTVTKKAGMSLYFCVNDGLPISTTKIDGKKFLNFSSYNYLDMAHNPRIIASVVKALKHFGTSASASRLAGGEKPIHRELEKEISKLIKTEDCIVFNSGHATNVTTIGHMMKKNDLILLDKLAHNSLVQGALLSGATLHFFEHNDTSSLKNLLTTLRSQYDRVLIVSEGVFSMDGDICPLPDLIKIKKNFSALLYLDEAHSMGVLGKTGKGLREYFNVKPSDVEFWMGTLSKAFGSCGGYIAGEKILIDYLRYSAPGFVYSCGISPSDTAAALASVRELSKKPQLITTLQERSHYFLSLLHEAQINTGFSANTPIIPIMIGDSNLTIQLCAALRRKGLFLQALFYPAVEPHASRLRAFINCSHTHAQLKMAAKIIASEMRKLNLLSV